MKIKNVELKIIQADLTELECDAIVNAANNKLLMGGGVAGVIKLKGGTAIEREAIEQGPISVGESIATKAGELKAKHVIHAATMAMDFKTDEHKIRQACASALRLADKLKLSSIALPALGCGTGGFPLEGASKIMTQEVIKFLRIPRSLKEIIFCLHEEAAFEVFEKSVTGYLNHFTNTLAWGPYSTVDVIIELPDGIILIERSNPPYGWALPGGFVDYGESVEESAHREAKEETNMELINLKQFHTYSDPDRDPRFHTIGTVFIAEGSGKPQFGDDAKGLKVVPYEKLLDLEYAFDHRKIIEDYLKLREFLLKEE